MKRFLVSIALAGLMTVGFAGASFAQDEATTEPEATEQAAPAVTEAETPATEVPVAAESEGFHQALKTKFIEGGPGFMAIISLVMILGLAFCLERIIYLNLADTNSKKLLDEIRAALDRGDVNGALAIARDTRGPIASIAYQSLLRIDQGPEAVERAITAYGGVQASLLEKNMSWITLFIALAPSLGFFGTVIGLVQAFDTIEQVGDISPTVVAGGMKVALITTIYGLIVAMILQVLYNYILSRYESILSDMEDASITLVDYMIDFTSKRGVQHRI
ncbi:MULTISPECIES: MotA/TolQ/ExbB proton channel family protein [Porphyromonas]|uniref:MotA/TolQ/ExbB proton channel family protein n=1 Tax=Porphyromonas TaxID=836 RepID=UPI000370F344|nr:MULTISPECIES: MotA/TolQ/ExbB proton channel family protein [Porphyromonas]MDD7468743.1 MotA/TolQ/ExbB proton channel family protein [Bacteroidales bacterium]MDY6101700.1 MotA/TolQ/ExbB proton channel family protein [Porphyromonas sp.]